MSDYPENNLNSDNHSDWHDADLSALYKRASNENPPQSMDAAILAQAQLKPKVTQKTVSPFASHWSIPMSMAAVLVLSISIMLTINRETPQVISRIPESIPEPMVVEEQPMVLEEQIEPETQIAASQKPTEIQLSPKEITPAAGADESNLGGGSPSKTTPEKTTSRKESLTIVGRSESEVTLAAPSMQENDALSVRNQLSVQATKKSRLTPSQEKPEISKHRAREKKSAKTRGNQLPSLVSKAKPAAAIPDKNANRHTDTLAAREQVQSGVATTMAAPQAAPAPVQKSKKATQSRLNLESRQATSGLLRLPEASQAEAPREAYTTERQSSSTNMNAVEACRSLNQSDCLNSEACILDRTSDLKAYVCRPAENPCEQGFIQNNAEKHLCEATPTCRFVAANCYCPPNLICVCGGGTPAQCIPIHTK